MLTPQQEEQALFGSINALNQQAFQMNKGIAPNEGIKEIPLQKEIYTPPKQPQAVQQDLSPLIDRVTSLEKQVTRFVNLIERNVAKNAKEITIKIKLNEDNDSTNSK